MSWLWDYLQTSTKDEPQKIYEVKEESFRANSSVSRPEEKE